MESGNEIGPFKAIEESTLATLVARDQRSTIFAWYAVFSGLAGSLGSLSGGWITQYLQQNRGWTIISAYRFIFILYSVWGSIKALLTLQLSDQCEVAKMRQQGGQIEEAVQLEQSDALMTNIDGEDQQNKVKEVVPKPESRMLGLTSETRGKVKKLGCLFGLDNLASGLVPL